jgi:GNAT superfamily N-acetyltransferase
MSVGQPEELERLINKIQLRLATVADCPQIRHIAEEAWPVAFGAIISEEFLRHELTREYSDAALLAQMQEEGHRFLLAESAQGEVLGFISYSLRTADGEPPVATVHKLYLRPQLKGKGYGGLLLNAVVDAARQMGAICVELSASRRTSAVQFYQHQGFSIVCELDMEVGPGFVRQGYLMSKPLTGVVDN